MLACGAGHRLRKQLAEGSPYLTYPNIMQFIEYEVTIIYEVNLLNSSFIKVKFEGIKKATYGA